MTTQLCFIGGGNMATSLVGGLVTHGYSAKQITVVEPNLDKCQALRTRFGIQVTDDHSVIQHAATIILAVKPQILQNVCRSLAPHLSRDTLVISIAAGIRTQDISRWLNGHPRLVRAMPNTPALIQAGITGLYATPEVPSRQRQQAEQLLTAAGTVLWVDDEVQLDAVTAVSGSGPAYLFLVCEAMINAAQQLGLSQAQAQQLTLATALGASRMTLTGDTPPAELRRQVTSPGGTTEQAINALQQHGLPAAFEHALTAARDKAVELADQLGKDNNAAESSSTGEQHVTH